MERVVWIPFPPPYSQEFMERTNTWVKERPEKNFRIIVYNPQRIALGAGLNPLLFNLINGSQIYLRGHGLSGDPHVTTNYDGRSLKLPITDSIDRLVAMGLQPNFRGTIKFYSCFSALKGKPQYIDDGQMIFDKDDPTNILKIKLKGGNFGPTGSPLAKLGANYFRQLGFQHCKYLGYKGPLSGAYVDSDHSPDGRTHKYCEEVTYDAFGAAHFAPKKDRLASDARKSF